MLLGISAYFHDSAAALITDGEIIAAAQEERFTRIKNDAAFPSNAVRFCLGQAGITTNDLDAIVFYEKPFLKFERLLETYYRYAPRGLSSFLRSMPVWLKEKLFMKNNIRKELDLISKTDWKKVRLLFSEHHLSHAASAFYPSSFEKAAILTIDGVGEWATASLGSGEGNRIKILREIHFPHSIGLFYSSVTHYCGFEVNGGEYKLMGLAPYGSGRASNEVQSMVDLMKKHLIDIKEDGSFRINQQYFSYATELRMVPEKQWEKLFGFPARKRGAKAEQQYADLAQAAQIVTEEVLLNLSTELRRLTGCEDLCMAGGVALNGVAAGLLARASGFRGIYIQPAAGDAGGAIGAAFAGYHIYMNAARKAGEQEKMKGCYLGPEYSDHEIIKLAEKNHSSYRLFEEGEMLRNTAKMLAAGEIIGWMQGRAEFGPRALGARSILADPRDPTMKDQLNQAIKFREGFRPFAPVITVEDVSEYFDQSVPSPYMMFVKEVKEEKRKLLPAITHADGTARLQTVDRQTNPLLWKLLNEFRSLTGCPVLINTSFNVKDEPIVNSPEDAYRCFLKSGMDKMVAGRIMFSKMPFKD